MDLNAERFARALRRATDEAVADYLWDSAVCATPHR
jgi:hypothetical protein